MSCSKLIAPPGAVLDVYSTVLRYSFFTEFMPAHGMDASDFTLGLRDVVGNWQGKPCFQTAAVAQEFPDAPAVIVNGGFTNSLGYTFYRESLAAAVANKYWIRFGVGYNLSSGLALGRRRRC